MRYVFSILVIYGVYAVPFVMLVCELGGVEVAFPEQVPCRQEAVWQVGFLRTALLPEH